jgi:type VI secretion system protein ImpB
MAKKKSMDKTPRVNIVYDVYTGGVKEERELPFVVGVLADLSGDPETPLPRLRDRKFVEIDKNNFDSVLAAVRPRIKIDVPNTLQAEGEPSRLRVDLNISHLEDFEPEPLARQIPELRELLEGRDRLAYLLANAENSPTFAEALSDIIKETERRKAQSGESRSGRPSSSKEGSER